MRPLTQKDDGGLQPAKPLQLSGAQRRRLMNHFKVLAAPDPHAWVEVVRSLPGEEVDLLVHSLKAAYSPIPSPWHDLYVEELERLFLLAGNALQPESYLREVRLFSVLGDDADGPLQRRIRGVLLATLKAPDYCARRAAICLLRHFVLRSHVDVVSALGPLRYDEDRQTRIAAFELLNAMLGRRWYEDMPYLDQAILRLKDWFDEL